MLKSIKHSDLKVGDQCYLVNKLTSITGNALLIEVYFVSDCKCDFSCRCIKGICYYNLVGETKNEGHLSSTDFVFRTLDGAYEKSIDILESIIKDYRRKMHGLRATLQKENLDELLLTAKNIMESKNDNH